MLNNIEAILFDMGGTLRTNIKRDEATRITMMKPILDLLGSTASPVEFIQLLKDRDAAYDQWANQHLVELNESDLWTKWMLPDWPAEKISHMAMQLNFLWRHALAERILYPETPDVILGLYRRGYRLGLVSNTTSSIDAPQALEDAGLGGCFDTIVTSSAVGIRKPSPGILLEAAARMGVHPERCVYIGDRIDWDVIAARKAGFCMTVILRTKARPVPEILPAENTPDRFIDTLRTLLDIFPSLNGRSTRSTAGKTYDISFSTMWGMKKFSDLGDFLLAARWLGLPRIELNHQVRPSMLEKIDLSDCEISSVHEPCPAVIAVEDLRKRDLLISSPDESRRVQGVETVKRSIDLAHKLGAHTVVVHTGQVQSATTLEGEMRDFFNQGLARSDQFLALRNCFVDLRTSLIGPYLEAVKRSLKELIVYAELHNIRLGLENRYHYLDIPTIDEMGELLALAEPERLGFLYDVGHAQVQDRFGFTIHEEWLKRYASRIIGVHLHDVKGINDHLAPGMGEVDFRMIASRLPKEAYRVLEVQSFNSPEQIRLGLGVLYNTGCITLHK